MTLKLGSVNKDEIGSYPFGSPAVSLVNKRGKKKMSIVRVGSTDKYSDGWDQAFKKKATKTRSAKKKTSKKAAPKRAKKKR